MTSALDIPVAEIMTRRLELVTDDTPLRHAAKIMLDNRVTGLPVTTPEGSLVGVLSWSDVLRALQQEGRRRTDDPTFYGHVAPSVWIGAVPPIEALGGTVREHMSTLLIAVGTHATLRQAIHRMARGDVHRVLVVDDNDNLAGLVSAFDVVRYLAGLGE